MSRREGQLFVGRLSKTTRVRDLEEIFEPYGRLSRCDVKYGAEMAYAFVDYEDKRDAEDCIRYENGREVCGSSIIVEWAKGNPRRPLVRSKSESVFSASGRPSSVRPPLSKQGYDECYRCHRPGHWARDCPEDRFGYRRSGGRRYSPSPRRKRSYTRSRSRDRRRRSKSRSRDRKRRSRSRDRWSRSRDRKSRDKKSRSKSRDSKSKSRSHSKSRSPSKSRSRSLDKNGTEDQTQNDGGSPAHSRSASPN